MKTTPLFSKIKGSNNYSHIEHTPTPSAETSTEEARSVRPEQMSSPFVAFTNTNMNSLKDICPSLSSSTSLCSMRTPSIATPHYILWLGDMTRAHL